MNLSPNNSIENIGNYKTYLDEALKNEKIRNIALSGNYGSGKSSIISTYFEQSENRKNNYKSKTKKLRKRQKGKNINRI